MEVLSRERVSAHQAITHKIIAAIEAGAAEFRMPWHRPSATTTRPVNAYTGAPYHGVNVISLWTDALAHGHGTNHWATYRQWRKLGAQVRKGERGSPIVFFEMRDLDSVDKHSRVFIRTSRVFNGSQVDGWEPLDLTPRRKVEVLDEIELFVQRIKATIRHGRHNACYSWAGDYIDMPDRQWFVGTSSSPALESYYAVLLHELTHWTGAKHRLDRDLRGRFGTRSYAMEELIAELGAAFLCADLGISNEPRSDHAAYVADWLTVLDRDQRAIFAAAGHATAAASYLTNAGAATPAKGP